MKTPTAIVDKSLLQRICDLPELQSNECLSHLQQRYRVIVPLVLHEEVLSNCVQLPRGRSEAVIAKMINYLKELHPFWMQDVYEIAYRELVEENDLSVLPWLSEEHQDRILKFDAEDTNFRQWLAERNADREEQTLNRKLWQKEKIEPGKFFVARDEKEFCLTIGNLLLHKLSKATSRNDLLDTFLGKIFLKRHPGKKAAITDALRKIDETNINDFKFSRNFLIASLVYLLAPISKVLDPIDPARPPQKLLDRQDQGNNFEDQEYVVSAFLCNRLITADAAMAKVKQMIQSVGWWGGNTIFIDRNIDIKDQIPTRLT